MDCQIPDILPLQQGTDFTSGAILLPGVVEGRGQEVSFRDCIAYWRTYSVDKKGARRAGSWKQASETEGRVTILRDMDFYLFPGENGQAKQ